jgi:hypothetical protein
LTCTATPQGGQRRLGLERLREQVPLGVPAAHVAQRVPLLLGLHALGDDVQPEGVRQPDDGRRDVSRLGLAVQVVHEAAVELERRHRQLGEVRQRGEPGAEVVDAQRRPGLAQLVEDRPTGGAVVHQGRLGELEPELPRARTGDDLSHLLDEARVGELLGREVDREAEGPVGQQRGPARHLGCGRRHHPAAERHDEAGLLRQRDEAGRREQPAARVLPADQRLEPHDREVAPHVDDRLVDEAELPRGQAVPDLPLQVEPVERALVHVGVGELEGVAAAVLGPVHRDVRVAEHLGRGLPGAGEDDTGTGRRVDEPPLEPDR